MTNRQWLESLSDQKYIDNVFYMFATCGICSTVSEKDCECFKRCDDCRIAWLQAEHKE